MPIENLAMVFGPTIVGYSSDEPPTQLIFTQTAQQVKVCTFFYQMSAQLTQPALIT